MQGLKLINANGLEQDLNIKGLSFTSLDGLGFERSLTFSRAGNDFVETLDIPVQKAPSGVILFDSEELYSGFKTFISQTPLKLCYMPTDTWYYLDCKVGKLEKSEPNIGVVTCNIAFSAYGMWYLPTQIGKTAASGDGKKYSYTYPYTYIDTTSGTILITNDSNTPAPCKLHIFGACTNPHWALTQSGEIISTGKVTATFAVTEKLVIDSNTQTMEIARRGLDNSLIDDEYQNSDFSTERFIYAPPGESKLSFSHDGSETINAIVEVKQLADTV